MLPENDTSVTGQVQALLRLLREECAVVTGIGKAELTLRAADFEKALKGTTRKQITDSAASLKSWIGSIHAMPSLDSSKRTTLMGIVTRIEETAIGDAR